MNDEKKNKLKELIVSALMEHKEMSMIPSKHFSQPVYPTFYEHVTSSYGLIRALLEELKTDGIVGMKKPYSRSHGPDINVFYLIKEIEKSEEKDNG